MSFHPGDRICLSIRTPGDMTCQVGSVRRWIDHCDLSANIIFLFIENKNIASPLWAVRLKRLCFFHPLCTAKH
jgi:hypothetical protein